MTTTKKGIKKAESVEKITNQIAKKPSFNFKLDGEVKFALKQARLEVSKIKKNIYINRPLSFEEKAFAFFKHS